MARFFFEEADQEMVGGAHLTAALIHGFIQEFRSLVSGRKEIQTGEDYLMSSKMPRGTESVGTSK